MQASNWISTLVSQLWIVPELLVCIAGLVACIVNMPKYTRPATMGLAGFVILIACVLSGVLVHFLVISASQRGSSASEIGIMVGVISLVRATGFAIGLALLAIAIFSDRAKAVPPIAGK